MAKLECRYRSTRNSLYFHATLRSESLTKKPTALSVWARCTLYILARWSASAIVPDIRAFHPFPSGRSLNPCSEPATVVSTGVSKFFRCEAPFLHHHEIEWTIMPSLRAQKPWTRPRLQAYLSAAPSHHCSGLFAHAKRGQPAWRVPSSGSPGSRGPLRRHS